MRPTSGSRGWYPCPYQNSHRHCHRPWACSPLLLDECQIKDLNSMYGAFCIDYHPNRDLPPPPPVPHDILFTHEGGINIGDVHAKARTLAPIPCYHSFSTPARRPPLTLSSISTPSTRASTSHSSKSTPSSTSMERTGNLPQFTASRWKA